MGLLRFTGALLLIASLAPICQAGITISLGVRETALGAGPIGSNGGASGGIEWLDRDAHTIAFDDNWHTLTWALDGSAAATAFAGASANGILDGSWGTIEHIRLLNTESTTVPISIYIDDIVVTTPSGNTTLTDFEGYTAGQTVMFQAPSFSGSTAGNVRTGSASGISDTVAQSGTGSYKVDFEFLDNSPTRWVRLTSFNTATLGNPAIPFGAGTSLSISFRAVPEPSMAGLLGFAAIGLLRRRRS